MKRFTSVHILAALFLLLGMGVQSYVSYSRALSLLQEKMELEMQIAQEKLLFELYDALEAWAELEDGVKKQLSKPRTITHKTEEILNRYPTFYACYVAFPPYYFPQEKWFEPTTYRTQDTIISGILGDDAHDYFEREWYKGAAQSKDGYWSTPYRDEDFDEPIYTYSKVMRDEEGKLICVIGIDFSLNWICWQPAMAHPRKALTRVGSSPVRPCCRLISTWLRQSRKATFSNLSAWVSYCL